MSWADAIYAAHALPIKRKIVRRSAVVQSRIWIGGKMDELAIETEHPAESGIAEACRARHDRVEYRLDVVRRA